MRLEGAVLARNLVQSGEITAGGPGSGRRPGFGNTLYKTGLSNPMAAKLREKEANDVASSLHDKAGNMHSNAAEAYRKGGDEKNAAYHDKEAAWHYGKSDSHSEKARRVEYINK